MNRIILIGNGFDLAHGMKTTYKDFLDNYWEEIIEEIKISTHGRKFENDEIFINSSPSGFLQGKTFNDLKITLNDLREEIQFKNKFLERITEKSNIESWVDVENEYYTLLKDIYKKNGNQIKNYSISDLNIDFQKIKDSLRDYLSIVNQKFKDNYQSFNKTELTIGYKIYQLLKPQDFSEDAMNEMIESEYKKLEKEIEGIKQGNLNIIDIDENKQRLVNKLLNSFNPKTTLRKLLQSDSARNDFNLVPEETLFLSFNYTFTEDYYTRPRSFNSVVDNLYTNVTVNHIHGSIGKYEKSPIIFGFGDELDDEYSQIEKLNNNDYLENIKSINYLESANYKNLLEFLNSQRFQIFIIGHSCGISDRTLLNTMFEHENCSSIKIFYHQKEDQDNYSDIVRNISRNFNDKAAMRDRVVNKQFSEKLS